MKRLRAVVGMALLIAGQATAAFAQTAQPGSTLQQEGFEPFAGVRPEDQLPAAPLLIGAYVFVMLVLFAYVFSVARRLSAVQQQVERLEGDIARGKKA